MQAISFYQKHLDNVSRSFAFCIARLPEPLRTYVSLSYLLCRVLDTVEDSTWSDLMEKQRSFAEFDSFLAARPTLEQIATWQKNIPRIGVSPGERELVSDGSLLLADFHDLPESIKVKLRRSISCMGRGMSYFSEHHRSGIRLRNITEVNQYCFFVAGIVGELLTDLITEVTTVQFLNRELYLKSQHFGLFLQKINILKDQKDDERDGKFFIPDKEEFIRSLKFNAQNALQYILQIPVQQKEFRLFCSWSLFIGLSSLNWIQKSQLSFLVGLANKIPRWMTEQLMARTESIIEDNTALQALFSELLNFVPPPKPKLIPDSTLLIFKDLYRGPLAYQDLCELML